MHSHICHKSSHLEEAEMDLVQVQLSHRSSAPDLRSGPPTLRDHLQGVFIKRRFGHTVDAVVYSETFLTGWNDPPLGRPPSLLQGTCTHNNVDVNESIWNCYSTCFS